MPAEPGPSHRADGAGSHAAPAAESRRFAFGSNWRRFLDRLDDRHIAEATRSLQTMLGKETLAGCTFLDIGSGSGLFSLAARRLGARVYSFDYDADSVACTLTLRERFFPGDTSWVVERGSVLDEEFIRRAGTFNIVYSWGVLHHTGHMWRALELAARCVAPSGLLYIAIYNHQLYWSAASAKMKRAYIQAPRAGRAAIAGGFIGLQVVKGAIKDLVLLRNPLRRYREYHSNRGMSVWHDWIDWVGGYPFDVARPDEIFDFYRQREFILERLVTSGGGHGCNEFVFRRASDPASAHTQSASTESREIPQHG